MEKNNINSTGVLTHTVNLILNETFLKKDLTSLFCAVFNKTTTYTSPTVRDS